MPMIDLEKQFKEEREPFIEYEAVEEPEKSKDPFVPAVEAVMDKEKAHVYIELS